MCPREKRGGIRGRARVRVGEEKRREEKEAKRARYTARGYTNSVTTGLSRQSPLQETQIKADLSSQDLFRALPTGSRDPEAILFPTVLRSVGRDDKEPEVETGPLLSGARVLVCDAHSDLLAWKCCAQVI